MKNILIFVSLLVIVQTSISQSGWYALSSGLNVDWYSVYFTSNTTGYVTGNDFILKTTDGGIAWTVSLYTLGNRFRHLIFVNQSTGIVIGRDGLIMKTTNSGVNWLEKPSGTGNDLLQFYMVNENTGYLCGGFGEYLKTTNGGNSWSGSTLCNSHMYSIFFTSDNTGWIAGDLGLLFKTTNGGTNWITKQLPVSVDLREIFFLNSATGWVTGKLGKLFCTTNSGDNWFPQNTGSVSTQNHIIMRSSSKGWMVGDTSILNTTDLGNHWHSQLIPIPIRETLVQSYFTSDSLGYIVGWGGVILKTTNGGEPVGIQPISSEIPNEFSLYQNYPNPFNPVTKIKFSLLFPSKGGVMKVELIVYDILGREIALLIPPLRGGEEGLFPGTYEVTWDASAYPSGVYFYRLIAGDASSPQANPLSIKYSETKKMVLIK